MPLLCESCQRVRLARAYLMHIGQNGLIKAVYLARSPVVPLQHFKLRLVLMAQSLMMETMACSASRGGLASIVAA